MEHQTTVARLRMPASISAACTHCSGYSDDRKGSSDDKCRLASPLRRCSAWPPSGTSGQENLVEGDAIRAVDLVE